MGSKCQSCHKREAKIHFTEIKDGKKTELHICEQCASEKNLVLAFPTLLSTIVKGGEVEAGADPDSVPATCPSCSLPYGDFKAKGRLGCPRCYEVFAPVLKPLLEKVHGKCAHVGKAPVRMEERMESQRALHGLEADLHDAIQAEDYERAAEIRDRIHRLREEGEAEGDS